MRQTDTRTLRAATINPFASLLLPFRSFQEMVYRQGDTNPPGLAGYQPRWEVVDAVLGAQQTIEARIDLMSDFTLLGLLAYASVNTLGGFRTHLYDKGKNQRIGADRGIQYPNLAGGAGSAFFLREPYEFDLPKSQILVQLQNLELSSNKVQLVLYGGAFPFTGRLSNEPPTQ